MSQLTRDVPKCLLEIKGKSLPDRQIESLRSAGIRNIGFVTGYRRELLSDRNLVEFYNPRWANTNKVHSLSLASEWLDTGPCVVSYSDIFYETSCSIANGL